MARVIGAASFSRRLKTLNKEAVFEVGKALFAAGEVIKAEARISITTGAVSGAGHIPSRPGQPPKNDTGILVSHINTIQTAPLRVEVESAAPYAVPLEKGWKRKKGVGSRSFSAKSKKQGPIRVEFGDSEVAARPYMGPAARKSRKEVNEIITKAVNRAVRKK